MEIILPSYLVGLLASILTEIVKLYPKIGESDILKSLIAIILVVLGTIFTIGWSWENFYLVLIFAFANYKMLIQPIAKVAGLRSQVK